jgi:hypothetical protein
MLVHASWMSHHALGQEKSNSSRSNQTGSAPVSTELRTVNRTVYTEKTELFATFRPTFIVGQPTRIGAHLSKLGDRFLPYADATVTFTLNVAGRADTATAAKPDRPGVFRLELTPSTAGTGRAIIKINGGDGNDSLVLDNVSVYPSKEDALSNQGPNQDAGAIKYSKENSWDENDYASGIVKTVQFDNSSKVLAIPNTAVIKLNDIAHVYVQRHPEAFDLRPLKTGRTNGIYVEIVEGLREGERIVTKGGDKMPRK